MREKIPIPDDFYPYDAQSKEGRRKLAPRYKVSPATVDRWRVDKAEKS